MSGAVLPQKSLLGETLYDIGIHSKIQLTLEKEKPKNQLSRPYLETDLGTKFV